MGVCESVLEGGDFVDVGLQVGEDGLLSFHVLIVLDLQFVVVDAQYLQLLVELVVVDLEPAVLVLVLAQQLLDVRHLLHVVLQLLPVTLVLLLHYTLILTLKQFQPSPQ